jgi:hypothetical protein
MSDPTNRSTTDLGRRARFREIARDILRKDRRDRKSGLTVDTGGAIARALERAYRQGFAEAQVDREPTKVNVRESSKTSQWAMIPPRPRHAFWSICLFIHGQQANDNRDGYLVPASTKKGTAGWQLVIPSWPNLRDKVIGEKTIQPLIRLGLLEATAAHPKQLVVSKLGAETWREFCIQGGRFPDDLRDL